MPMEDVPMSKVLCSCYNVTKKDIKKAVKKGAGSLKDVKKMTKATKACGKCRKKVKRYVKKLLAEQS